MKLPDAKTTLLYALAIAAIGFGGSQLVAPKTVAAASCCTYGENCSGSDVCCKPTSGENDCSQTQTGYCKASCG